MSDDRGSKIPLVELGRVSFGVSMETSFRRGSCGFDVKASDKANGVEDFSAPAIPLRLVDRELD
jgi:hypothetical protein